MATVRAEITPCLTCVYMRGTWNAALLTDVDIGSHEFSCTKYCKPCIDSAQNAGKCYEKDFNIATDWSGVFPLEAKV